MSQVRTPRDEGVFAQGGAGPGYGTRAAGVAAGVVNVWEDLNDEGSREAGALSEALSCPPDLLRRGASDCRVRRSEGASGVDRADKSMRFCCRSEAGVVDMYEVSGPSAGRDGRGSASGGSTHPPL